MQSTDVTGARTALYPEAQARRAAEAAYSSDLAARHRASTRRSRRRLRGARPGREKTSPRPGGRRSAAEGVGGALRVPRHLDARPRPSRCRTSSPEPAPGTRTGPLGGKPLKGDAILHRQAARRHRRQRRRRVERIAARARPAAPPLARATTGRSGLHARSRDPAACTPAPRRREEHQRERPDACGRQHRNRERVRRDHHVAPPLPVPSVVPTAPRVAPRVDLAHRDRVPRVRLQVADQVVPYVPRVRDGKDVAPDLGAPTLEARPVPLEPTDLERLPGAMRAWCSSTGPRARYQQPRRGPTSGGRRRTPAERRAGTERRSRPRKRDVSWRVSWRAGRRDAA